MTAVHSWGESGRKADVLEGLTARISIPSALKPRFNRPEVCGKRAEAQKKRPELRAKRRADAWEAPGDENVAKRVVFQARGAA